MGIRPLSNCNYGGGGGGGGGAGAPGGGKVVLEALWNFQGTGQIITAAANSFGDGIPGGNAMCRFDPGAGGDGGTPAGSGTGQGGTGGLGCWDSGVNQQSGAGTQTGNKGGNGGSGGAGAGGGVLIVCRGPWDLAFTGAINTRGSNKAATSWGSTNYGSCKIFGLPGRASFNGVKECGHLGAGGWGNPLVRETKSWPHPVC